MEEHRAAWQCTRPPELDDIDLIAAADGEASLEVHEHLAACPACAERLQTIVELQGRLHERLYRLFCPSSDDLAAFAQGVMIQTEHARLNQHVGECPHCQSELALLEEIAAVPLARPPNAPNQRIVAQPQRPGPPSNAESSVYRAGAMRITLSIERRRGALLPRLRGAVRGHQHAATASLICNGRVISAAPVNEQGGFVLDELSCGECWLSLRLPGCEVVVEALCF